MKELIRKLKPLLKNKEIVDLIIFGSSAKSKINPNDIDIALLTNNKKHELLKEVKLIVPNADVELISVEDFGKRILMTLLKEGYSIKYQTYIHDVYGFDPVKLYKYNLKQLTNSKKVMFERGIKTIEGLERLSNSVVLVPLKYSGQFEEFLRQWNMDIDTKEYELIPMMRKEELF